MATAVLNEDIKIAVPQKYKDFVVRRQYQSTFWILVGVIGGVNALYYFSCLAFHWKWQFPFQADLVGPVMGLISYIIEARKPWYYEINAHQIKLFVVNSRSHLANLKQVEWKKIEIIGTKPDEWQGLPCLTLKVIPEAGTRYLLVYGHAEAEEIRTKVLPLIEKYRHQYRHELWADKLRS
jgi:hypothetical protein